MWTVCLLMVNGMFPRVNTFSFTMPWKRLQAVDERRSFYPTSELLWDNYLRCCLQRVKVALKANSRLAGAIRV